MCVLQEGLAHICLGGVEEGRLKGHEGVYITPPIMFMCVIVTPSLTIIKAKVETHIPKKRRNYDDKVLYPTPYTLPYTLYHNS